MKVIPAILLCLAIPVISISQQFTASVLNRSASAYAGIDNPVSCTVQGYSCKYIELTTNNGKMTKEGCSYIFHPERPDNSEITIVFIKGNTRKKIGGFFVAVREMPVGQTSVGGQNGGEMIKAALIHQQGILGSHQFEIRHVVDSFTVTAFRNDTILYHKQQKGNLFSEETRTFFRSLQAKDVVLFSGIISIGPDKKRKRANPIEFIIR